MSSVVRVGVGEFRVGRAPDVLVTHSLGPCIGLTAYDPRLRVGGMIHFMLPDSLLHPVRAICKPDVFADTGIKRLLAALKERGAHPSRLVVTMAGGATILDKDEVFAIGRKNIEAARRILGRLGLVVNEGPLGGTVSRTLTLNLQDGQVDVRSLQTRSRVEITREEDTDLNVETFQRLTRFIYRATGIQLPLHKRPLVKTRLARRMRLLGLRSFSDYLRRVESRECADEQEHLFNAISTNQTSFFREMEHFRYLERNVLPAVVQARKARGERGLRLWSAGCASGEEAYSMAMVVDRYLARSGPPATHRPMDFRILATDLNTDMVQRANEARYPDDVVTSVPPDLRRTYLTQSSSESGGSGLATVDARLRARVAVGRLNLMDVAFPFRGPFDVIFLRNVVMYFSAAARTSLLERLRNYLAPWGYFFLGTAESLHQPDGPFVLVGNSIYQRYDAVVMRRRS